MELFTLHDSRPIHFVGMGGAGMSALALIALRRGVPVTGCDPNIGGTDDVVRAGGVMLGDHDPAHVAGVRAVVHTSAVSSGHPELMAAREAGIPVLKRARALQVIIEGGAVVAVAGTHGKTTTTVMVTDVLAAAGRDPTGIAGGRVARWGGNACLGGPDLYVVEADEYDKSFLSLNPTVAVINNVEEDHLECYEGGLEELERSFVEFASRADRVLIGADDAGSMRVARGLTVPTWSVGVAERADMRIVNVARTESGSRADLRLPDGTDLAFELQLPGLHNIRNAAMALGSAAALGADLALAAGALARFVGVGRRFEIVGEADGITIVDDYAHHPTEIAVTIAAARQKFPRARLIVAFQPHLYSRTEKHADAMGIALAAADIAVVTEIYRAREEPIPGVTGRNVVRAAEQSGAEVRWVPEVEAVAADVGALVRSGDVVVTMGAGNITDVSRELLEIIRG